MKKDKILFVALHKFAECCCTYLIDITVGVFLVGDQYEFYLQTFFECHIQSAEGSLYTSGIAIINDRKIIGIFFYQPQLIHRKRRTTGCHYIFNTSLVKR
ncbi:hypothetical protein D9M68_903860 [compost metagenome]